MREKKRTKMIAACLLILILLAGCGRQSPVSAGEGILMDDTDAPWTAVIEEKCGISGFGRPFGTVKESLEEKKGVFTVTFEIDEEITDTIVDGYARSVWKACLDLGKGGTPRSAAGWLYSDISDARRNQEPLDYYIWYYYDGEQKYRLGLYSTNMEEGRPGGLVLRIEKWDTATGS